jgi:RimJ/RimL family protein N-acetyltransferase
MPRLTTARLELIPVTVDMLDAVVRGDRARAEALVGAAYPDAWPDENLISVGFPLSLDAIRADPVTRLWGDTMVLTRDGPPRVVGSVVFHGKPDPATGIAEVGYAVADAWRGRGFAAEATGACVDWALAQDGITAVQATTFAWHAASLGVIRRLGMERVGTREHESLGELLVFERRRPA